MSAVLHIETSVGFSPSPTDILDAIAAVIDELESDARDMNVVADWSRLYLTVGDEYEEYNTFTGQPIPGRAPKIIAHVPASKER